MAADKSSSRERWMCPKCEAEIPRSAFLCPSCREPLTGNNAPVLRPETPVPVEKPSKPLPPPRISLAALGGASDDPSLKVDDDPAGEVDEKVLHPNWQPPPPGTQMDEPPPSLLTEFLRQAARSLGGGEARTPEYERKARRIALVLAILALVGVAQLVIRRPWSPGKARSLAELAGDPSLDKVPSGVLSLPKPAATTPAALGNGTATEGPGSASKAVAPGGEGGSSPQPAAPGTTAGGGAGEKKLSPAEAQGVTLLDAARQLERVARFLYSAAAPDATPTPPTGIDELLPPADLSMIPRQGASPQAIARYEAYMSLRQRMADRVATRVAEARKNKVMRERVQAAAAYLRTEAARRGVESKSLASAMVPSNVAPVSDSRAPGADQPVTRAELETTLKLLLGDDDTLLTLRALDSNPTTGK